MFNDVVFSVNSSVKLNEVFPVAPKTEVTEFPPPIGACLAVPKLGAVTKFVPSPIITFPLLVVNPATSDSC